VNTLLDQVDPATATFMGDAAFDSAAIYQTVISRNPKAEVTVPPGKDAIPSPTDTTAPTQRDEHVFAIQAHGWSALQSSSGYTRRSTVESANSRYKSVIGGTLRSRGNAQRNTEVAITTKALNPIRKLGQAIIVLMA
jgi:hypothetical protein